MSRRAAWLYTLWVGLVVVAYVALPAIGPLTFGIMVLTGVISILVGVRRNRPRRRLPWYLFAGGQLSFAIGTVTSLVLAEILHRRAFPSVADAIFLGLFIPMLLLAMRQLTRSGATIRDRASMIDAMILTAGAGLLSWVFLINPYLENPNLTVVEKAISVAYPLSDVLFLALLVRFAIGAPRSRSVILLVLSGVGLLTADVLYGLNQLNGDWELGGPIDLGWFLFYIAGGAAALSRSMTALTEPRVVLAPTEVRARRLVLGVASLVAPTILFVQALSGPVQDGVVIAIGSAVLVILALARMSVVAGGLRRTMTRERELRRACEALLSATDAGQVRDVVHRAIAALLPPDTPHRAVLLLEAPEAREEPPAGDPVETEQANVSMRYTRSLPASATAVLGSFELTLHCPLSLGDQYVGDLYVAADEAPLVDLQEAAPVLAGQAASILSTFALNREIDRRNSEAYFRTLILNATDVILIVDAVGIIKYASPSAHVVFGTDELTNIDVITLVEPGHRPAAAATLHAALAGDPAPADADAAGDQQWIVQRPDGERVEVELTVRDLRHESTVDGLVLTLRDVTERRRLERELLRRAYVDPLTGLGNRLQFQDTVRNACTNAAAGGTTAGVLLVNIDDFRLVNDTMGHDIGDALLIAIGERLTDAMAGHGPVARLGADEFGTIVAGATGVDEIEVIVERVITAFVDPFLISGSAVTALPSIGVSTTADAADSQQLLSQADVALGAAKSAGKARWRRYEASLHAAVLQRMQLRAELDQAIVDSAFTLHYQPIVDLATGRPRGLEALVRWQHPTRGMVPPLEFIQVAEECGLIVPLGEWVMRTAIEKAAGWHNRYAADPPYVSVNVSVRQFRAPGFVSRVLATLTDALLPANLLTVEITESLLLGDQESIESDIAVLRQAGVKVSIDDFGTGYSSLSYLHRVPVDTLKLDKSFVDTISTSTHQLDLVRGIIQLAGTLRLDVVAEGIETVADQELLVDSGCAYGQGYLFARPLPDDQVDAWLDARVGEPGHVGTPAGRT
jgi:diguanylate cyclase (GGDEF)-like protein/PAS domain S-box-containing protein